MDKNRSSVRRRQKPATSRFRYKWRTGVVTVAIVGTILTISTIAWQVIRGWQEQRNAAQLAIKYHLMTSAAMMYDNVLWGSMYMSTAVTAPAYITKTQDNARAVNPPFSTPSLTVRDLQHLVDSAFLMKRIGGDSLTRGYFRMTVRNKKIVPGSFQTSGAMRFPEFQNTVTKHIIEADPDFLGSALPVPILLCERPQDSTPVMFAIAKVWGRDSNELVFFGITYKRAMVISYYAQSVYKNTSLLPSNFNGVDWMTAQRIVHDSLLEAQTEKPLQQIDTPEGPRNNELVAVQIFDTDKNAEKVVEKVILWETPNISAEVWDSPYQVEYDMPSMGLFIRAAIDKSHADQLVAVAVPLEAEQQLLAGIILLGVFFIGAALMELRRQRQLVRTRADFVSSISHELRTPLAHVSTLSETLYLGGAESPEQEDRWLRAIHREAQRLGTMVENILLFARGEREHLRISRHTADIAEIVHDVASIVEPFAVSRSANICIKTPLEYFAEVDAGAIRQVLLNLLDNAIKYGPTSGQTITVTLAPLSQPSDVTIMVDDQGPGIPPHERERIWSPFVRLDNASNLSGETGGSGLGLNVVRTLVEQHGGVARIAESEGGGARFIVTFSPVEGSVGGAPVGRLRDFWPAWLRQVAMFRVGRERVRD